MIGKISGILDLIDKDTVLVDVSGLGYMVNISLNTKNRLPQVGEKIALYTEMMVREDSIQLIGFSTALEKEWFRNVETVGISAGASTPDYLIDEVKEEIKRYEREIRDE